MRSVSAYAITTVTTATEILTTLNITDLSGKNTIILQTESWRIVKKKRKNKDSGIFHLGHLILFWA